MSTVENILIAVPYNFSEIGEMLSGLYEVVKFDHDYIAKTDDSRVSQYAFENGFSSDFNYACSTFEDKYGRMYASNPSSKKTVTEICIEKILQDCNEVCDKYHSINCKTIIDTKSKLVYVSIVITTKN